MYRILFLITAFTLGGCAFNPFTPKAESGVRRIPINEQRLQYWTYFIEKTLQASTSQRAALLLKLSNLKDTNSKLKTAVLFSAPNQTYTNRMQAKHLFDTYLIKPKIATTPLLLGWASFNEEILGKEAKLIALSKIDSDQPFNQQKYNDGN